MYLAYVHYSYQYYFECNSEVFDDVWTEGSMWEHNLNGSSKSYKLCFNNIVLTIYLPLYFSSVLYLKNVWVHIEPTSSPIVLERGIRKMLRVTFLVHLLIELRLSFSIKSVWSKPLSIFLLTKCLFPTLTQSLGFIGYSWSSKSLWRPLSTRTIK